MINQARAKMKMTVSIKFSDSEKKNNQIINCRI